MQQSALDTKIAGTGHSKSPVAASMDSEMFRKAKASQAAASPARQSVDASTINKAKVSPASKPATAGSRNETL